MANFPSTVWAPTTKVDGVDYPLAAHVNDGQNEIVAIENWAVPFLKHQTLTDGATVNWDASAGNSAQVTFAGNRTMANPTNLTAGYLYRLRCIQDATGGRVPVWGSAYIGVPEIDLAISAVTVIFFLSDGSNMFYIGGLKPVIPQVSKSAAYTTVLTDAGAHILHPSSDNNARTFTIDSNANVPYPLGTPITFINKINTVTLSITTDTLTLAGAGTTGSRTLAANGIATAVKIATTEWMISGTGLT